MAMHPPRAAALAAAILAMALQMHGWPAASQPVLPGAKKPADRTPAEALYVAVTDDQYVELDAIAADVVARDLRSVDGRSELYLASRMISDWYRDLSEEWDEKMQKRYVLHLGRHPDSVIVPILQAMQMRALAWRARGTGFASTVTPEGWQLFRERSVKAWQILQKHAEQSSRSPLWYQEAIAVGMDAGVPADELRALHDEGLKRFPGYQGIYFNFGRQFSPRWGGSYAEADAYVREQVAAPTNREGEALYARLYWLIDQYTGSEQDFFEESQVDWTRMRAGFELLMQRYPNSARNLAAYLSFACRANDTATYLKWRKSVDRDEFWNMSPQGYSLEICDARFFKKT